MKIGLIIKTLVMLTALGLVIYAIQALKSPSVQTQAGDPNSIVGLLVGGDQRLFNWCPPNAAKVEILGEAGQVVKELTSPQDISAVCELLIGGFAEGSEPPNFKVKLRSYSPGMGSMVELEAAEKAPLFRVQGLPFSCPGLVKALDRLGAK